MEKKRQMKNKNILSKFYRNFFLISNNMVSFISGIFISISTGILTSAIPKSIFTIGVYYIISSILMFFASMAMMIWAITIKPIQDDFNGDAIYGKEGTNDWYAFIHDSKRRPTMIKVNICCITAIFSFVGSIVLWVIA